MSLLVKICGLSTPETLNAALDAGADMVGFVFFPASPRHISLQKAVSLGAQVGGRATKVALSVDADDHTLAALIEAIRPAMLQLHGHEPPARVAEVRRRFGLPVMKALPVATAADLAAIAAYAPVSDRLLFDARPPKDATRPGGLGRTFDWRLLENLESPVPYMLSGGLDPDNVAAAVTMIRPPGVDVSSGVERKPGEKDPEKIRAFIRAARDAAAKLAVNRVASTA
jgi:phosphoribosylanthranilate isomerase